VRRSADEGTLAAGARVRGCIEAAGVGDRPGLDGTMGRFGCRGSGDLDAADQGEDGENVRSGVKGDGGSACDGGWTALAEIGVDGFD